VIKDQGFGSSETLFFSSERFFITVLQIGARFCLRQPYSLRTSMKLNLLSLLTALLIGITTRTNAEPASDSPVTANSLEQLQAEYERRRADALRPVTAWYRAQLEILGHQLEEERTKVAETFWQDDQPELKQTLLSPGWIWRSAEDAEGVALTFLNDGSVQHAGLHGTWKITGPSEVTVQPNDDDRFILRFNSSLKSFTGDRRGVTGERIPPHQSVQ
jgi:hypothetical protein